MDVLTDSPNLPLWRRTWVAVAACGVLLVLSLFPPVLEAILRVDHLLAESLNSIAGTSPVLDRLLIFVSDEDGHERLLAFVFLYFVVRTLTRSDAVMRTRDIGTALFVFLSCIIYILVDEFLDDVLTRESPSLMLESFRSINWGEDWDIDLEDDRTWPCSEAALLFITAFILFRRSRWVGGSIAMVAGLFLPLGRVVTGLNWPTDIYLGALPIAYVFSAVMVESRVGRVENYLAEGAAAALDQAGKYVHRIGPALRNVHIYWRSHNVLSVEVATKRFILHNLPKLLQLSDEDKAATPRVEVPLSGVRSVVRLVKLGSQKVVVRVYPVSRRYEATQHASALTLLNQSGVRAPRLLYFSVATPAANVSFVVEEFVAGKLYPPEDLQPAHLKAVADTLLRLHSLKSERWGPIESTRTEGFSSVLARRAERILMQLARSPHVSGTIGSTTELQKWFHQQAEQFSSIKKYSLIHSKLHRENAVFEPDGSFCLLDCASLEWSVPGMDINTVHRSLCGDREDLIATFNEAYFGRLSDTTAAQIRATLPFFHAMSLLSHMQKFDKRIRRKEHLANSRKMAASTWETIQRIMRDNPVE